VPKISDLDIHLVEKQQKSMIESTNTLLVCEDFLKYSYFREIAFLLNEISLV
jgi:hypothetical protein